MSYSSLNNKQQKIQTMGTLGNPCSRLERIPIFVGKCLKRIRVIDIESSINAVALLARQA